MRKPRTRFTLPAFDALAQLARRDPSALERLRERLTDEIIRRASTDAARRRLEGLKFRIDMERRRAPDALAACVRISALMHSSLADLHQALSVPGGYRAAREPRRSARLLGFPDPNV
jgi:Protein of unknown function (DUF3135)